MLSNFLYFCSRNNKSRAIKNLSSCCELLSNFLYFCSRNNRKSCYIVENHVVNCSQIFCTFAVETTIITSLLSVIVLWIALKFFVLLQSKQPIIPRFLCVNRCELLSYFLYFCSRNNLGCQPKMRFVLWIALKFFVLLQSKQLSCCEEIATSCCELLSNFLYFCSRNNMRLFVFRTIRVVNCSQIFCTFAVETTSLLCFLEKSELWIALKFFVLLQSKQLEVLATFILNSCELLSNFLYFCSRNNLLALTTGHIKVVNCSQIFCTFAVETTT